MDRWESESSRLQGAGAFIVSSATSVFGHDQVSMRAPATSALGQTLPLRDWPSMSASPPATDIRPLTSAFGGKRAGILNLLMAGIDLISDERFR